MKAWALLSHPLFHGRVSPDQQPSSAATVLTSKSMHMQPDHRSVLDVSEEGGVRLQGQHDASSMCPGNVEHIGWPRAPILQLHPEKS